MVEPEDVEFDGGDIGDVNLIVVVRDSVQYVVVVRNALVSFGSYELLDVFVRREGCFH